MKRETKVTEIDPRLMFEEGGKWCPVKHGLSSSGIKLWMRCQEQFRLHHQEDLDGRYTNEYLQFGLGVHSFLDEYRSKGCKHISPKQITVITKNVEKELRGTVKPVTKAREEFERMLGLAEVCCRNYQNKWIRDIDKEWIAAEQTYTVNMFGVKINLTLDGLFKDNTGYWLIDTKTKSRIDEDEIGDTFVHDVQFMLYMAACSEILDEYPKGIIYDGVRRPGLKVTQKDEAEGGLSAFLIRVEEDVQKRPDHYFFRLKAKYYQREVEKWKRTQLKSILEAIMMWYERKTPHYMNPQGLVTSGVRSQYFDYITKGDRSGLMTGAHWRKYEHA